MICIAIFSRQMFLLSTHYGHNICFGLRISQSIFNLNTNGKPCLGTHDICFVGVLSKLIFNNTRFPGTAK